MNSPARRSFLVTALSTAAGACAALLSGCSSCSPAAKYGGPPPEIETKYGGPPQLTPESATPPAAPAPKPSAEQP